MFNTKIEDLCLHIWWTNRKRGEAKGQYYQRNGIDTVESQTNLDAAIVEIFIVYLLKINNFSLLFGCRGQTSLVP